LVYANRNQLLEHAKQLQGETSATDEGQSRSLLLIADSIRAAGLAGHYRSHVKTIADLRTLLEFVTFGFVRIDVFSSGLSVKSGFSPNQ